MECGGLQRGHEWWIRESGLLFSFVTTLKKKVVVSSLLAGGPNL